MFWSNKLFNFFIDYLFGILKMYNTNLDAYK